MKISFQNQDIKQSEKINTLSNKTGSSKKVDAGAKAAVFEKENPKDSKLNSLLPGASDKNKVKKSLTDLRDEAGAFDASVNMNYRVVLSNTLSPKDYAKAQEQGFDHYTMDPDDVVTIQDRIKAEVAKGGEVIIGYNDSMDEDVLAEALGSETLARSMERAYAEADLPLSEENIEDVVKAKNLADSLTVPTEDAAVYLIENDLDLSIWGLYLSENSGSISSKDSFIFDTTREVLPAKKETDLTRTENAGLLEQVKNIVKEAGYEENSKEALCAAQWLLDKELPVNKESIDKYLELGKVEFPISDRELARISANAVASGEKPINGKLIQNEKRIETIPEKAVRLEQYYFSEEAEKTITARIHLEEIRLSMTAEVNIKLLESDYFIDTAPIEEFIESLKEAEKQVASGYFKNLTENEGEAVEKYRLMNEVNRAVSEVKEAPALTVGTFTNKTFEDVTFGEFRDEAVKSRDSYVKAGESYEALMTAPRSDLGDNIKKAFSNVTSLAREIGVETSEDNLRAIRILGYNSMEITRANVERISEADIFVRSIITKMNPAAVLNMIREGVNPLETSFAELNTYFDSQQTGGYEQTAKSYSEFLYGLEMQDNITPEERESYIGIYRLIRQVEKSEGAAIGTLLDERAQLSFKNLLTAARTRRFRGIDVRVDESTGGIRELVKAGTDIMDQIGKAFEGRRFEEENADLRKALDTSAENANILDRADISKTAENLVAIENLLENSNALYDELLKYEKTEKKVRDAAKLFAEDSSFEDFDKTYDEATSEIYDATEELAEEPETYLDLKSLSLVRRELGLSIKISDITDPLADRDYVIPMEFGDEISKVRLSFRRAGGNANVSINTVIEDEEIQAYFELSHGILEGYLAQNSENALKKLKAVADIFGESLKEDGNFNDITFTGLPVIKPDMQNKKAVLSEKNKPGKDAQVNVSDGSERRILLQVTKVFLQVLGRA
jgi:hypothetical protein